MDTATANRETSPSVRRGGRRHVLGAGLAGGALLAACGAPGQATSPAPNQADAPVTLEHVDCWGPTTPILTTFPDGIKRDFEATSPNSTINYTFVQAGGVFGARQKRVVNPVLAGQQSLYGLTTVPSALRSSAT
jgi:ABC-type glycerol-3-phosphate transport system substrate-binding protein